MNEKKFDEGGKKLSNAKRVQDELRSRICTGHYGEADRLPSERKLAEELGVSRTTVRTALASLSSEHLIRREQGNGTLINSRLSNMLTHLEKTWEFTNIIVANGKSCTMKPVNLLYRLPTNDECRMLKIKENRQIISIDRIFLADGQPVIHSNNIIPVVSHRESMTIDIAALNIVDFVDKYCDEELVYGITDISSSNPPWNVAAQMKLSIHSTVIKLTELFYTKKNEPLVIARSFVDTSKLKLQISRYLE